ncbi:MAG TPA: hypothetical protein ENG00_01470 [Candidatus Aenigmarchaeota archaeon]|nr:hypothetical protein [Candidatus Aenigmarchaeota archaeon]
MEGKIEDMKIDYDDKLYEIKDVIESLLSSLRVHGFKGVPAGKRLEEIFASKEEVREIREGLEFLKKSLGLEKAGYSGPDAKKPEPKTPEEKLNELVLRAEYYLKNNQPNVAKRMYTQALFIYTKLNAAKSEEEVKPLYEKINNLYRKLAGISAPS